MENLLAILRAAVPQLPKKWSNVQNLFIKAADSVALPFYQSLPEAQLTIETPQAPHLEDHEITVA